MRVVVDPVDEVHSRAAASLASSPLVTMVGLLAKTPPASWGSRAMRVEDSSGFDVVVGPGPGHPNVTPDGTGTVAFADRARESLPWRGRLRHGWATERPRSIAP